MKDPRVALWQFLRYLCTGTLAVIADVGLTFVLLFMGVQYVVASVMGGITGFFVAFFLHRHVAFRSRGRTHEDFVRYCMLGAWNLFAQNAMLVVAVELIGVAPGTAKIFTNVIVILWNFALYRLFVYR